MLLYHLNYVEYLCTGMLIVSLLVTGCVWYAHSVNLQRSDDDPKKTNYHVGALLFAPITWPFFLITFVSLFLIRALFYGVFLILFTISLIMIPRISPEPTRLEIMASNIGEKLLKANTQLIRLFLRPWTDEPETI